MQRLHEQGYTHIKADLHGFDEPDKIIGADGQNHVPDVTAVSPDGHLHIYEVETNSTTGNIHTESQHAAFSARAPDVDGEFHVVIAKGFSSQQIPSSEIAPSDNTLF